MRSNTLTVENSFISPSAVTGAPSTRDLVNAAAQRMKTPEGTSQEARQGSSDATLPEQETYETLKSEVPNVVAIPKISDVSKAHISFYALQEWEGYVLSMDETTFTAELIDKTHPVKNPANERAVFDLNEVNYSDRALLEEGAVFRWSIGYQTLQSGTKQRISQIIFRRMPAWSEKELEESRLVAAEMVKNITWE